MPFREKIAWISVVTTSVIWGGFFGFMAVTRGQYHGGVYAVSFFGALILQAILVAAAAIVTAILSPKEASASRDERDTAISHRAYAIAYPVLLTLVLCVIGTLHLGMSKIGMAYGIMGAIVIAEIVHYGAQIVGYRMGGGPWQSP
ncbi:hypothetical protein [Sphingomonas sp. HMP6]|uniref:hypothetical protein n=1 Tax=Sphingomonas sp. HMP6 TaxID=1517551 RepID=UPI0015970FE7|nr:hypothetical protein [Sphingomonas sp. HMP6]BCA57561.1 hypothetical protein HMP06_0330 [Sphingomonas sp. HMP6]